MKTWRKARPGFICISSGTWRPGTQPTGKAWGVLSFAALGMFSAEFGANDRALLVSWSSHRLLARPAQNAVSSDFLWSCIIFPCFLYNCSSFWSLPSLYGRRFKRPVLQTCGQAMSVAGGVPLVTPMEAPLHGEAAGSGGPCQCQHVWRQ